MMELLDFSVDALVFSQGEGEPVLHTQGLSPREVEALSRLIDAMQERKWKRLWKGRCFCPLCDTFPKVSLVF